MSIESTDGGQLMAEFTIDLKRRKVEVIFSQSVMYLRFTPEEAIRWAQQFIASASALQTMRGEIIAATAVDKHGRLKP